MLQTLNLRWRKQNILFLLCEGYKPQSVLIFPKNFKAQELSSHFPTPLVNLSSKEKIFEIYKLQIYIHTYF